MKPVVIQKRIYIAAKLDYLEAYKMHCAQPMILTVVILFLICMQAEESDRDDGFLESANMNTGPRRSNPDELPASANPRGRGKGKKMRKRRTSLSSDQNDGMYSVQQRTSPATCIAACYAQVVLS
jgi:hypothetical protein